MALVTFSGNISDIVGRMGGSVFQRTSSGTIMRPQRGITKKANNNLWQTQANATMLQQAWQALSDSDRNLWELYANFRQRPTRKKSTVFLRGQATFFLENSIRIQFDQHFGVISPVINSTPILAPPPANPYITSIVNAGFTLTVGTSYAIPDDSQFYFLYITKPLLASQISGWNKYKLLANLSSTGSSQVITSQYEQAWFNLPAVGGYVNTELFLYDKTLATFGSGTKQRIQIT